MDELELLSARLKVKDALKAINHVLDNVDIHDKEKGILMGIKSILNRQNEEFSKSRYTSNERG